MRQTSVALAAPLSAEDCAIQSMADASPVKWHLAHTTWFFETFVLVPHVPGYRLFDPAFGYLFNSYYNAIGERHPRPERGMLSRPSLEEVRAYRQHVDDAMLAASNLSEALVELGLHHEQQHQELILTDVKHMLSRSPLKPAYQRQWPLTPIRARAPKWVGFAGGLHEIGHAGGGFAFDNETPRHKVWLEDYEIASHPVTHGDLLEFMADGGYRRPELWLSAGWDFVRARGWEAPEYWTRRDGQWHTFTLHGEVPVDPNTPICHVSFFEAEAYARWAGKRLPNEAEWEVAASWDESAGVSRKFPWGNELPTERHANVDQLAFETAPVGAYPLNMSPLGCYGMIGDVWEWTSSDFVGYPGFRAFPYPEYSEVFFGSEYKVLRGGSWATRPRAVRNTFRNWDYPIRRQIFSGFRCASDD